MRAGISGEPPSAAELETLALDALARLPDAFKPHVEGVVVQIADFAEREVLDELGITDPWELSGLYHGRPMDQQSVWDTGDMPPIVTLFRMPLLAEWVETGGRLDALIFHVVVHEIGHHFGLSDDDMHALEDSADD
ncbi:metallopeptidase family protein [Croceicoccus mobilis]|uniref:Zn-dependent protease n=1 Tax=Croceicoccus mobilis TaxID=1703339 RepID=A0A917DXM3_9SPHN|nr:metallopeptidase family protein [Croceicoccus mobilis]GGD78566.1 Zn-dependent protease [Croceicoccus mobilis]